MAQREATRIAAMLHISRWPGRMVAAQRVPAHMVAVRRMAVAAGITATAIELLTARLLRKAGPRCDSLIVPINSLMARFNSLFSRNKFPVPQHRELCSKPLDSLLDFPSNSALQGLIELNSL